MSVATTGTEGTERRETSEGAEPTDRRTAGREGMDVGYQTETNDVHQLLEQMARMRELLSKKEVEVAEVRSELTFTRSELETAREEATEEAETAEVEVERREADSVRRNAELAQEELDGVNEHLATLKREQEVTHMEYELQKYRESEELQRDFDKECKYFWEIREPRRRGSGSSQ